MLNGGEEIEDSVALFLVELGEQVGGVVGLHPGDQLGDIGVVSILEQLKLVAVGEFLEPDRLPRVRGLPRTRSFPAGIRPCRQLAAPQNGLQRLESDVLGLVALIQRTAQPHGLQGASQHRDHTQTTPDAQELLDHVHSDILVRARVKTSVAACGNEPDERSGASCRSWEARADRLAGRGRGADRGASRAATGPCGRRRSTPASAAAS